MFQWATFQSWSVYHKKHMYFSYDKPVQPIKIINYISCVLIRLNVLVLHNELCIYYVGHTCYVVQTHIMANSCCVVRAFFSFVLIYEIVLIRTWYVLTCHTCIYQQILRYVFLFSKENFKILMIKSNKIENFLEKSEKKMQKMLTKLLKRFWT